MPRGGTTTAETSPLPMSYSSDDEEPDEKVDQSQGQGRPDLTFTCGRLLANDEHVGGDTAELLPLPSLIAVSTADLLGVGGSSTGTTGIIANGLAKKNDFGQI